MSTTKLGGYSFIIASIFLFVGGMPIADDFERIGSILSVYGFMGLVFAVYALCNYFRKEDKDNGLLSLIPILALIGWTGAAYGSALDIAENMASIETVNSVASMSNLIGFTGAVGGFISAALIGIYVLRNSKFIPNSIYRVLTILFLIGLINCILPLYNILNLKSRVNTLMQRHRPVLLYFHLIGLQRIFYTLEPYQYY